MDPLVVTLALDEHAQALLQQLRSAHFPRERDVVPAHVSLFHALPGEHLRPVLADLRDAAPAPFPVHLAGVRSLGRGAAVVLDAPDLTPLHRELARRWEPWLTAQDRQPLRPHVTVQNKVDPGLAQDTVVALTASLVPREARAVGVDVWRYRGGPWEHVARVPFEEPPAG
jgi:2'-5' RNA ligase